MKAVRAEPVEAHSPFDKLRMNEIDLLPIAENSMVFQRVPLTRRAIGR
jgi:hypothetical protein